MQIWNNINRHSKRNVSLQHIPEGYMVWDSRTLECIGTVLRSGQRRRKWNAVVSDEAGHSRYFRTQTLKQAIERIVTGNI